ncbi:hypothetical protein DFA_11138 [Cavenderia fasciculata]|uniref:ComC supersandwich domain-containing protein n=1 Tax=Cavenderia fasciculata TaxID=261658 RepID=F4QF18_CACFS|nr:uncharacterized protein DFA_11138 [Cavenderia fasciculata]EGG13377.1 hypothetical protein DFA_11138 [Cavenderia fasciculata]|eukprot:XP_004350081.1 hypothetical protein DFA_11138 [Cavenderia fasciculata]
MTFNKRVSFLAIVVAVLVCNFNISHVSSQQIPQEELDSVKWMIQQVGNNLLPLDATLCNAKPYVKCTNENNVLHFTELYINVTTYVNIGLPDSNVAQFNLPYLKILEYRTADQVAATTDAQLFIGRVKNMPNLTRLVIENDPSLVLVPSDFPINCPKLTELYLLNNSYLTSIPGFFNQSNLETIVITKPLVSVSPLSNIYLDSYIQLVQLKNLTLRINPTVANITLLFDVNSFPLLTNFDLSLNTSVQNTYTVTWNSPAPNQNIRIESYNAELSFVDFSPALLQSIEIVGPRAYINPIATNAYTKLANITYSSNGKFDFPLISSWPPALRNLNFVNNNLNSFPSVILPAGLQSFNLENSKIKSPINGSIFTNVLPGGGKLKLNLNNNPEMTGALPDSFCSLASLELLNTGITIFPSCFKCFKDVYPNIIKINTPIPQIICGPTFTTTNNSLIKLGAIIQIQGSLLGWGNPDYNIQAIVPNSHLLMTNNVLGLTSVTFALNPLTPRTTYTFDVVDTTIKVKYGMDIQSTFINSPQSPYYEVKVWFDYINPNVQQSIRFNGQPCAIRSIGTTSVICRMNSLPDGNYTLIVTNAYMTQSIQNAKVTSITYPVVSSAQLTTVDFTTTTLELFGYFGNSPNIVNILLNQTIQCSGSMTKNSSYILCTADPRKLITPGPLSILVTVDSSSAVLNNLVFIPYPPSTNLKQKCIDETQNCYGHGECNDQGICICQQGYQDNCKLKVEPNVTFVKNETQPTATFQLDNSTTLDDYKFEFSMVSIEEIDSDNNIVSQLITNNWTVSYDNSTTSVDRLVYTLSPSPLQPLVTIQTTIEFSNISRSVLFGDTLLNVSANSIKIGVNVTNWNFQSFLTHLRIVFTTTLDADQQSFVENCQETQIPIFSDDEASTESYLRVIKGSTQFYGRFLSYSYSNGRKTFTKNEFINQTRIVGQQGQDGNLYTAYIGIHVPQCSSCLLDPDFSALVTPKNENTGHCGDDNDNSQVWKIAVGASVGGAVFIALLIGTIIYLKDRGVQHESELILYTFTDS